MTGTEHSIDGAGAIALSLAVAHLVCEISRGKFVSETTAITKGHPVMAMVREYFDADFNSAALFALWRIRISFGFSTEKPIPWPRSTPF
jgi:hypothetical protein